MKFPVLIALGLIIVAWGGASSGVAAVDPGTPVDEERVRRVDVTGDGQPDTITLRIKGENPASPFAWTLTISSLGEPVLSHACDDTRINGFFGDAGYVGDCRGYPECKSKWYFKDLLANLIVPRTGYDSEGVISGIDAVAGKYLAERLDVEGERARAVIATIKSRLQNGQAIVITIPDTPATAGPLLVFSPEVRRFVEIYRD